MKINIEKIYIDGELPKSCASCQFLVHCDECEGHENYCPFIGSVGYDISDSLIDGTPVTPVTHRHRHCPVVKRPHEETIQRSYGEWIPCSEKFPDEDGKYLVTTQSYITKKLIVSTSIFVSSTKEWYPDCIAWMPLPEPYKGEGEKK